MHAILFHPRHQELSHVKSSYLTPPLSTSIESSKQKTRLKSTFERCKAMQMRFRISSVKFRGGDKC
jgi:hypothetical protein